MKLNILFELLLLLMSYPISFSWFSCVLAQIILTSSLLRLQCFNIATISVTLLIKKKASYHRCRKKWNGTQVCPMEELTSNYLNLSAHKTEGITRKKTCGFTPPFPRGKNATRKLGTVTLAQGTWILSL